MNINIPIGKIIQEEVFKMNISLQELSERINIHKKTLLLLFNSKTMDLSLLYKWCCILNMDFFKIYSKYLIENEDYVELETIKNNGKVKKIIYEDKL